MLNSRNNTLPIGQQNLIIKEKIMNVIYLISGTVVVILIYCLSKRNKSNQKAINPTITNQKVVLPKMSKKNKWLYPTDNFGKMEKGRVN
jgi:hypothetical protein